MTTHQQDANSQLPQQKLDYERPHLVTFGSIGALTAGGSGTRTETNKPGTVRIRRPNA